MTHIAFSKSGVFQEQVQIKTPGEKLPPFIMYRGRLYQFIKKVSISYCYEERSLLVIE